MRFQKKILLNYVALLCISVMVICILYYHSSKKRYVAEEYSYLTTLTGQMMKQLELEYSSMQEATESLLSDPAILDNLKILSTVLNDNTYRLDAKKNINIRLNTYHIVKNYYRVLIYNEQGDLFASYDFDNRKIRESIPEEQRGWIREATGIRGKTMLIPPHTDPWGLKYQPDVYGIIREILGYKLGYLEVQQTAESLNRIFDIYDENIRVTAVFDGGKFLYGDEDAQGAEFYRKMGMEKNNGIIKARNPETGKYEIISSVYSDLTGVTILLSENQEVILKKMSGFLWMAFWIILLFTGLFVFFIIRVSVNMARPINELRRQMEQASFDNMEEGIHIENSVDEIRALTDAYERLLKRLKESLTNEKNLSYLQLQASYDLLQAQINPHFFHNVLNVISSRGLILGDESICDICDSLSGMLRYATGNKMRYASIADELDYLNQYLYLMKLRYQHKIEYRIDVEDDLKGQMVPKIVFQQIVENSIKHGFNGSVEVMKVTVTGRCSDEGDRWIMEFRDNGEGIRPETVSKIKQEMEEMKINLMYKHEVVEMEIGGMGLLNTYARLILFFGDRIEFEINGSENGTTVIIVAPFAEPEDL